MKKFLTIITISTLITLNANAQETNSLSKLQNDIFKLEETISELVGQQEQLQYQLQQLQKNLNQTNTNTGTGINEDIATQLQNLNERLEKLETEQNQTTSQTQQNIPAETTIAESEVTENTEATSLSEEDIKNIYEEAFLQLTRKDYVMAEQQFKDFLQNHEKHQLAANASYWLAETYYVRKNYKTAAAQFLKAYNDYPEGNKRFDSLLKLALSLRSLEAPKDACKTLAELLNPANDPNGLLSASTRRRAEKEQEELRC